MIATILVPLDGSPLADAVLPRVERIALREGALVHLLHVIGPRETLTTPEQAELTARAHLDGVRARLEARGVRVESRVARGDPAAVVLTSAVELRADLIAMSSHGRSGVLRWIRGSVAERVLREATAPLLVSTPRAAGEHDDLRLRRILVPLDGSERAAAVLPLVATLARADGAEVILLRTAWDPVRRPVLAAAFAPEKLVEGLAPFRARLVDAGVSVRALAAYGDAASEVCDAAEREQVDLVAMTTHGRTGLARVVDGSVSETVLRHCRRPVLLVRCPE